MPATCPFRSRYDPATEMWVQGPCASETCPAWGPVEVVAFWTTDLGSLGTAPGGRVMGCRVCGVATEDPDHPRRMAAMLGTGPRQ